jgi:hypothetical protein
VVQVDPIKPKLKPPGTKRLKLKCDILLSNSAFKVNLRRYIVVALPLSRSAFLPVPPVHAAAAAADDVVALLCGGGGGGGAAGAIHVPPRAPVSAIAAAAAAGEEGDALGLPASLVGRCRLTLSNPR